MLRKFMIAAALIVTPCLVGCSGAPGGQENETPAEATEQDLSSKSIADAVNAAFEMYEGPKPELTIRMRSATLPRALRTAVATARRSVYLRLTDQNLADQVVETNVYAVYTNTSKRTLAGYALWLHANDGSQGAVYLVGFNSRGTKVVDKDDVYQDDGDSE